MMSKFENDTLGTLLNMKIAEMQERIENEQNDKLKEKLNDILDSLNKASINLTALDVMESLK